MRKHLAPVVAIAFLLINTIGLAAIATLLQQKRGRLHVDSARFRAELTVQDFVHIPFDAPLVSREDVGKPIRWGSGTSGEGPVTFEPPLEGRFFWADLDTIEFRPADGLKPGSVYQARIASTLRAWDGSPLELRAGVTFRTPALAWNDLVHDVTAPDNSLVVALRFSDRVAPEQLPTRLRVRDARGRDLSWNLVTHAPEREIRVLVAASDSETLSFTMAAGLHGDSGPLGLVEDQTRTITIQRSLALTEVDGETSTWGAASLSARFNRELDPDSLDGRVRVEALRGGEIAVRAHAGYNSITLEGALDHGTAYRVTFDAGLRSKDGHTLGATVTRTVEIGSREPGLRFVSGNAYHFRDGMLSVPLETVGLSEVEVSVLRIYPNNLVHFRNAGRPHRYNWSDYENFGRLLATRTVRIQGPRSDVSRTQLDLRDLLREGPQADLTGATVLFVRAPDEYWTREAKLVIVTDLAVLAKKSAGELVAWVSSLSSAQPVADADVTVFSRTNQTLFSGRTGADGFVRFTEPVGGIKEQPFLIAARAGDDLTYLTLADGSVSDTGFDVGGAPTVTRGQMAFACTERGIYRPGETAHLTVVTREVGTGASPVEFALPGEYPVQVKVHKPDGSTLCESIAKMSPEGIAEVDVAIPSYAPTGVYAAEVRVPGHEETIGGTRFQVEDFLPNRMELKLTADAARLRPGATLSIQAHGAHLFGSPAAGRRVTASCTISESAFAPEAWQEFAFQDATREFGTVRIPVGEIVLDDDGNGAFAIQVPEHLHARGGLMLGFTATLLEVGGRGVSASLWRSLDPAPYYLGVRVAGDPGQNSKAWIEVAAVAPEGGAAAVGEVKATLSRLDYVWALREDNDQRLRYEWSVRAIPVQEITVPLAAGRGRFDLDTSRWGEMRVVVSGAAEGKEAPTASLDFYLGSWGCQPTQGMRVDRIEIVPDKPAYQPGETARIAVRSPFPGKLVLFVQRERVLMTRLVDLAETRGVVEIPVDATWAPNVFIAATVIRPLKGQERWGAQRAYGVAPLALDCSNRALKVAVAAPKELRPGETLTVAVDLKDAAGAPRVGEVVLAAVDEGILRLTGWSTQNPWNTFYARRRLEVATADVYGDLFPEDQAPAAGGQSESGGGEGLQRHLNPVSVERVRSVVLWSARVRTDAAGHAETTWTVPEFDGALRVMALGVSAAQFGAGEAPVLVRRPFVVSESLPRVATAGDRFTVPVALFNHTPENGQARVEIDLAALGDAPVSLQVEGPDVAVIDLPAGKAANVSFELVAGPGVGPCRITVRAAFGREVVEKVTQLAVRPPAPLIRESGHAVVKAGESKQFRTPEGLYPGTGRWTLTVSDGPRLQFGEALNYVVHYPYGCVEQTTSSMLPLIRFKDLARMVAPDRFPDEASVDAMVDAGITRLMTMQTYEGGIGFWPGDTQPYPYGSVYAAQGLLEAEAAGYKVPKSCRDALLSWIRRRILEASERREDPDRALQAYACSVLALAGDPPTGLVQRLLRTPEAEQSTVRAHLARSLHRAGKHADAVGLLGPEAPAEAAAPARPGVVVTPVAETAIALDAWLEIDPESAAVPVLAERLNQNLSFGRWGSTHENALALLALGKYAQAEAARAHGAADAPLTGSVTIEQGVSQAIDLTKTNRWSGKGAGGTGIAVSAAGRGRFFCYWTQEGVPVRGVAREGDSNLTVRRRYCTRDGRTLDLREGGDAFQQGETYVVELTVRAARATLNLALSDLLPGGLEIENPRLATSDGFVAEAPARPLDAAAGGLEWVEIVPSHQEMRDDRLLLFFDAPEGKVGVFRYVVRAVTPGSWVLPALSAECMYDPAVTSVWGQGRVTVK